MRRLVPPVSQYLKKSPLANAQGSLTMLRLQGVQGVQDVGLRAKHGHNGEKDGHPWLYCMGRLSCSLDERSSLVVFPFGDVKDY